jgi:hypothetical protein
MNSISQAELARRAGVRRQAISQVISSGAIPYILEGKKKKINPEDPAVKYYISNSPRQREAASENRIEKPAKIETLSEKPEENKPEIKEPSENQDKKDDVPEIPSEIMQIIKDTVLGIKLRTIRAEMKKKELIAAAMEKKLLPRHFIENVIFRYIERLGSNIERASGVNIEKIGQKILEAGEVTPAHIEEFTNMILKITHETKLSEIREIRKYDPVEL